MHSQTASAGGMATLQPVIPRAKEGLGESCPRSRGGVSGGEAGPQWPGQVGGPGPTRSQAGPAHLAASPRGPRRPAV